MKTLTSIEDSCKREPGKWPTRFPEMVEKAREKFVTHLDYLSERLVVLALFDDKAPPSDKKALRKALARLRSSLISSPQPNPILLQHVPYTGDFLHKSLRDFVGRDSLTLFDLMNVDPSFLTLPEKDWQHDATFLKVKEMLHHLPCVNDAAERVLGLATEVNSKSAPKSEEDLQALYKVIKGTRGKIRELATSSEIVTKMSLINVTYEW